MIVVKDMKSVSFQQTWNRAPSGMINVFLTFSITPLVRSKLIFSDGFLLSCHFLLFFGLRIFCFCFCMLPYFVFCNGISISWFIILPDFFDIFTCLKARVLFSTSSLIFDEGPSLETVSNSCLSPR